VKLHILSKKKSPNIFNYFILVDVSTNDEPSNENNREQVPSNVEENSSSNTNELIPQREQEQATLQNPIPNDTDDIVFENDEIKLYIEKGILN
jgi:hypothetical protein